VEGGGFWAALQKGRRQHCRRDGDICVNLSVGLQSIFQTAHNPSSLSASNRPRLQMGKPKRTKGTTAAAARAGWDVVCVRRSVCAHSRLQIYPFILRIMNRARARAGERWAISWPPLSDTDSLFSSYVHAHACLHASI